MSSKEIVILRAVAFTKRSQVTTQQIYAALESGEILRLTEEQLSTTQWQGRPAYQHWVRSYLSNLTERGDLERTGRGVYRLTEQGRRRTGY